MDIVIKLNALDEVVEIKKGDFSLKTDKIRNFDEDKIRGYAETIAMLLARLVWTEQNRT